MAMTGFLYEVLELRLVLGLGRVPPVLGGVLMMSSFTSGLPSRDICTNGPLLSGSPSLSFSLRFFDRAVLPYMPMTGFADVAAGLPSLVTAA